MEQNQKKTTRTILMVIGGILVLIGIIKFSIIGYYPSEALPFGIILIGGAICLYIAQKIKIVKPGEDKSDVALPGKWKCNCGSYNSKDEESCGNCGANRT